MFYSPNVAYLAHYRISALKDVIKYSTTFFASKCFSYFPSLKPRCILWSEKYGTLPTDSSDLLQNSVSGWGDVWRGEVTVAIKNQAVHLRFIISLSLSLSVIFSLQSKQAVALAFLQVLPNIQRKIIPLFYSFSHEIEKQVNGPSSVWDLHNLNSKT